MLLDINPARETPITGVTSQLIFDDMTISQKRLIRKDELISLISDEKNQLDVVILLGAGDIDLLIEPIKLILDKE